MNLRFCFCDCSFEGCNYLPSDEKIIQKFHSMKILLLMVNFKLIQKIVDISLFYMQLFRNFKCDLNLTTLPKFLWCFTAGISLSMVSTGVLFLLEFFIEGTILYIICIYELIIENELKASHSDLYIYIYIYRERERVSESKWESEREREWERKKGVNEYIKHIPTQIINLISLTLGENAVENHKS